MDDELLVPPTGPLSERYLALLHHLAELDPVVLEHVPSSEAARNDEFPDELIDYLVEQAIGYACGRPSSAIEYLGEVSEASLRRQLDMGTDS